MKKRLSRVNPVLTTRAAKPPVNAEVLVPEAPNHHGKSLADVRRQGELSFERARAQWQLGDWDALVALDTGSIAVHPDRAKLALLVAVGHQHLGQLDAAARLGRAAIEWGCSKQLLGRVMLAGVYDALAVAACAEGDHARSSAHFATAALLGGGDRQSAVSDGAKAVRELARAGLLPQAASLLGLAIDSARALALDTPDLDARICVLQTELELLQGALILAEQRGRLWDASSTNSGAAAAGPEARAPADLKARAMSQLGQDLWVLEQTSYKRGGFFVEFGATDGLLLSNTHLLENAFDWHGLCAEPNPKLFEQLKRNRRCTVSNACIAGETGRQVDFIFADAYGGIAGFAHEDSHAGKREAYRRNGAVGRLTTISLHDFLKQHGAPRTIDYLSLDTEGSEFDILRTFPFDQWHIELITVEHNFTPRREDLHTLLQDRGYHRTPQQWDDWYRLAREG